MDSILPHSDEIEAHLEKIRADYLNPEPRRAFAEWLIEKGDRRGELMKLQCEPLDFLPDDPRKEKHKQEEDTLKIIVKPWIDDTPFRAIPYFMRGTIYLVVTDTPKKAMGAIRQRAKQSIWPWVDALQFPDAEPELMEELAKSDLVEGIRELVLFPEEGADEICRILATSSIASQLVSLSINRADLSIDGFRSLTESEGLSGLRELTLKGVDIDHEAAELLGSEESKIQSLRRLNLYEASIDDTRALFGPSMKNLEQLNLASADLGPNDWQGIKESPYLENLRSINISDNRLMLEEDSFDSPNFAKLEDLDLSYCGLKDHAAESLKHCPQLKRLALNNNKIKDPGAKVIASNLKQLVGLDLEDNKISDEGWAAIQSMSGLEYVNIEKNDLKDPAEQVRSDFPEITEALTRNEMDLSNPDVKGESFEVTGHMWGDKEVKILVQLPHLANIKTLDLHNNDLEVGSAEAIATSPMLRNLEHLYLETNSIGDGAKALAESKNLKNLQTLRLEYCKIGLKGMTAIGKSENLSNLRKLIVGYNASDPEMVRSIAENQSWLNLEVLDISSLGCRDSDLEILAANPALQNLTTLNIAKGRVTCKGAKALAASPYIKKLEHLDLGENPIESEGVKAIVDSENFAQLQELVLHSVRADSSAIDSLVQSENLRNLKSLTLSGNQVGSALIGLENAQLPSLESLDLDGCNLSRRSIKTFQNSSFFQSLKELELDEDIPFEIETEPFPVSAETLALVKQIQENPENGLLREEFADVLEGLGCNPSFVEYMRGQIEHGKIPYGEDEDEIEVSVEAEENEDIFYENQETWAEALAPILRENEILDSGWDRGAIVQAMLNPEDLIDLLEEDSFPVPILSLILDQRFRTFKGESKGETRKRQEGVFEKLASLPRLKLVTEIQGQNALGGLYDKLFASEHLHRLRKVAITSSKFGPDGVKTMVDSPSQFRIKRLDLEASLSLKDSPIRDNKNIIEAAKYIAGSEKFEKLERLEISYNGAGPETLKILKNSPHLPEDIEILFDEWDESELGKEELEGSPIPSSEPVRELIEKIEANPYDEALRVEFADVVEDSGGNASFAKLIRLQNKIWNRPWSSEVSRIADEINQIQYDTNEIWNEMLAKVMFGEDAEPFVPWDCHALHQKSWDRGALSLLVNVDWYLKCTEECEFPVPLWPFTLLFSIPRGDDESGEEWRERTRPMLERLKESTHLRQVKKIINTMEWEGNWERELILDKGFYIDFLQSPHLVHLQEIQIYSIGLDPEFIQCLIDAPSGFKITRLDLNENPVRESKDDEDKEAYETEDKNEKDSESVLQAVELLANSERFSSLNYLDVRNCGVGPQALSILLNSKFLPRAIRFYGVTKDSPDLFPVINRFGAYYIYPLYYSRSEKLAPLAVSEESKKIALEIQLNPEDNDLRLKFADELDSVDADPAFIDLIRKQVQGEPDTAELCHAHGQRWCRSLKENFFEDGSFSDKPDRGAFSAELMMDEFFEAIENPSFPVPLSDIVLKAKVDWKKGETKKETQQRIASVVERLVESPHLQIVHKIYVEYDEFEEAHWVSLFRSSYLDNLAELSFYEARIGPEGLKALAHSPSNIRLKKLNLELGEKETAEVVEVARIIAESEAFHELEELSFYAAGSKAFAILEASPLKTSMALSSHLSDRGTEVEMARLEKRFQGELA